MTKRKPQRKPRSKRKQTQPPSKLKLINLVLFMIVLTLSVTIASYFLILDNYNQQVKTPKYDPNAVYNESQLDEYRNERINKYFQDTYQVKKEEIKKESLTTQESSTLSEETPKQTFKEKIQTKVAKLLTKKEDTWEEYTDEFEKEYIDLEKQIFRQKQIKVTKPIKKESKTTLIDNRPKLAIVIDDVTIQSQVNKIRNIGFDITMAFLPPTSGHRNSAKIAQGLPFYMIHFPMQATNFKHEEENTLHIGDSYEKIEKRVAQIRKWYPNAVYTNNHTGSKFTSHDQSMDYLIRALKKYDFIFVDSRTTSKTVVRKYTDKYGLPYITRNIFLDNKQDYKYIQNQLKKAIRIAKKTGSSIAIGHPHNITLKVIKESKHLMKGLNLVYIDKIPVN